LGIYSYLEGKWYDLVDWVDGFIPINPLIDKIDKVFPSFALLIILILLLIISGFAFVFLNAEQLVDAEITVKSTTGEILSGAEVSLELSCNSLSSNEIKLITNEQGKAKFRTCLNEAIISVKKETYAQKNDSMDFSLETKKTIQLSKVIVTSRLFNAKIVDEKNLILSKAKLTLICTINGQMQKTEIDKNFSGGQPLTGYEFLLPQGCTLVQLKATSAGYNDSTVSLTSYENNRTIKLEKENLEGEVIFTADSPAGKQGGTTILYRDEFGREATIITDALGSAKKKLALGEYSYNALVKSVQSEGEFTIEPNKTTEVIIYFDDLTDDLDDELVKSTTKQLYFKIVDANSPLLVGEARAYKTKDGNTSIFSAMPINQEGVFGPTPVLDVNNVIYTAIIKSANYETKLVRLEPRLKTDTPQIIQMKKGGHKLSVKVIDDLDKPIEGVSTELFISGFPKTFESALDTDRNGNTFYRALPQGTYTITAKTTLAEGSQAITLNSDTNITLKLVTGSGTIKFNFVDEKEKAFPQIALYKKFTEDEFVKDDEMVAIKGYFTTKSYKAGTQVKVIIEDENYLSYESFVYTITRGAQEKTIYLTRTTDLPNQKETQLILRQIYSVNPITSKESSPPTRITPGEKYYLLFDLILNKSVSFPAVANFFVGREDKLMLDKNTFGWINSGQSTIDSTSLLSAKLNGLIINPSVDNPYLVDEGAKQLNVVFDETQGIKQIPIIVGIEIDKNALGKIELHYQSKFGGYTSLAYKKEFEIGKAFCLGSNCSQFLFSHYLKWGNKPYAPLGEMSERVQIGDEYKIKTIVENTSDEGVGEAELNFLAEKSGSDNAILFKPDKNIVAKPIFLEPLSSAVPVEVELSLLKTANDARIKTSVKKVINEEDKLKGVQGNLSTILLDVKNKNVLQMSVVATSTINVIHEKTFYSLFYVKVVSREGGATGSKKNVKAYWSARFDGEEMPFISGMETDANGNYLGSFDASNIESGRKIIFEAVDENNSIPAVIEVTVTKAFAPPAPKAPDCVAVKIGGTNISTIKVPYITVEVGSTGSISVVSECEEDKVIWIASDIASSPAAQFKLKAKTTQTITLDGTQTVQARSGMLGAYPVQIMLIDSSGYREIGFIDVVMKDSGSDFELQDAIFDFRKVDSISSAIVNKKYAGRKDVYYPKMNIGTSSVSLSYNKPGIPQRIETQIRVTGIALESFVGGLIKTYSVGAHNPCEGGSIIDNIDPPTESNIIEDVEELCEEYEWDGEVLPKAQAWIPEDESIPSAASGTPSQAVPPTGSAPKPDVNASLSESQEKVGKISFTEATGDDLGAAITARTQVETGDYGTMEGAIELGEGESTKEVGTPPSYFPGDTKQIEWFWSGMVDPYGNPLPGAAMPDDTPLNKEGGIFYNYLGEKNMAYYVVDKGSGMRHYIERFGRMGEEDFYLRTYTSGKRSSGLDVCSRTGYVWLTAETAKVVNRLMDRHNSDMVDVVIDTPVEGKVYDFGPYEATPVPEWTNIDEVLDHEEGDAWETESETSLLTLSCAYPQGFVSREYGKDVTESNSEDSPKVKAYKVNYDVYDPLNGIAMPLAEYGPDGITYYTVFPWDIPAVGMEFFLKDGHVYGKYRGNVSYSADASKLIFGPTQTDSPSIDFTLTKINLLGAEYAVISVTDWISGTEKKSQAFQVKLLNNPTNCYTSDGVAGITGKEFVPRLKFDWDWTSISANQCDSTNPEYTYCDGTQFLVSLFKKISNLNDTYLKGAYADIPKQQAFYSYLIKDNYTQEFLNDFDEYYSSAPLTSIGFNTTESAKGYDQFITENKIKFKIRTASGVVDSGLLPKGGLYQISLDVERLNPNTSSLFDNNAPNANITVTFNLVQEAPNYNPFYETPFDGEVGKKGDTYERANYGASLNGGQAKLNSKGVNAAQYSNALMSTGFVEKKSLAEINDGVVLKYDANPKQLTISASQPNPVIMKVTGTGGAVNAQYNMQGFDSTTPLSKKWVMKSSTLGRKNCVDFEDTSNLTFNESVLGTTRTISWPNGKLKGTIGLATTFFTPKVTTAADTTIIVPVNASIAQLKSLDYLQNGPAVSLTNLDSSLVSDYDTLQGILDRVANEEMCMTQESSSQLMIWWNPDHLNELIEEVGTDSGHSCGN